MRAFVTGLHRLAEEALHFGETPRKSMWTSRPVNCARNSASIGTDTHSSRRLRNDVPRRPPAQLRAAKRDVRPTQFFREKCKRALLSPDCTSTTAPARQKSAARSESRRRRRGHGTSHDQRTNICTQRNTPYTYDGSNRARRPKNASTERLNGLAHHIRQRFSPRHRNAQIRPKNVIDAERRRYNTGSRGCSTIAGKITPTSRKHKRSGSGSNDIEHISKQYQAELLLMATNASVPLVWCMVKRLVE